MKTQKRPLRCAARHASGVATLGLAAAVLSAPGYAQVTGVYGSGPSLSIGYVGGPLNQAGKESPGALLDLQISNGGVDGKVKAFTMDTGSTGIAVSGNYFTPGKDDTKLTSGTYTYTSSGAALHGTYYQTNVTLYDKGKAVGTTPVKVLLVDYVTCNFLGAGCVPTPAGEKDQSTLYAGVGFNRNNMTGTSVAGLNPLVNVKLMSGQQLEPGYIVGNNAVTIGLSQTTTAGFSFVKLTQDVATSIPGVPQWNQTVMTVAAGGATGSGSVLLDAGIGYMFLSPPSGSSLDALPNRALAPDGTLVEIWLPGQNGSAASYSFKARQAATCTPDAANSLNPCNVTITHDGAPFVNTSRAFFSAFDYLYDPINGYLGYRLADNGFTNSGVVTPVLALQGPVPLPGGFQTTLPVALLQSTTLVPSTGGATFNAAVNGFGHNLTVQGNGIIAFNGIVDLGAGTFAVQQGTATINASLAAATINIGPQGSLTGNGPVTGNVIHSGTLSPGNSIGTLNNTGNFTQTAGSIYQLEVNNLGQSDRVNVAGAATLQGGTVNFVPLTNSFAAQQTYTILSATGGVNGAYSGVQSSNYAFLFPSLSYDANNVYLNVAAPATLTRSLWPRLLTSS